MSAASGEHNRSVTKTAPSAPPDYYETLGVSSSATSEEISIAFRLLAKKLHPDHSPNDIQATEAFKAISRAHATLSRPRARAAYDARRAEKPNHHFAPRVQPKSSPSPPITFITGTAMVLPTTRRAKIALASGIACIGGGLAIVPIIFGLEPVADSFGRDFTLWFVVAKLIIGGGIFAGLGWWRLRNLAGLAARPGDTGGR